MKLPIDDAERCITLLEKLDLFALAALRVLKKETTITPENINEIRLKARKKWQADRHFIGKFISVHNKELSEEDVALLRSWQQRERSTYIVIKYDPDYALLYSLKYKRSFGVLGLSDSIGEMLEQKAPLLIEASLLPYKNQIVVDGLIKVGALDLSSSAHELTEMGELELKHGTVIFQLF